MTYLEMSEVSWASVRHLPDADVSSQEPRPRWTMMLMDMK